MFLLDERLDGAAFCAGDGRESAWQPTPLPEFADEVDASRVELLEGAVVCQLGYCWYPLQRLLETRGDVDDGSYETVKWMKKLFASRGLSREL